MCVCALLCAFSQTSSTQRLSKRRFVKKRTKAHKRTKNAHFFEKDSISLYFFFSSLLLFEDVPEA